MGYYKANYLDWQKTKAIVNALGGDFELTDPTATNKAFAPGREKPKYNKRAAKSVAAALAKQQLPKN